MPFAAPGAYGWLASAASISEAGPPSMTLAV